MTFSSTQIGLRALRGDLHGPRRTMFFSGQAGLGLSRDEFILSVREAAAKSVRDKITGRSFAASIDPDEEGIFDALAIFLPTETSFTAGAVRKLDGIERWNLDRLSRAALCQILVLDDAEKHCGRNR